MSKATEEAFEELLYNTGILKPVTTSVKGGKVEAMCRIVDNRKEEWPALVENLLVSAEELGLDAHVCRRYVMKEGALVYGFHVSFDAGSAKKLKDSLPALEKTTLVKSEAPKAVSARQNKSAIPIMSYQEYKKQTSATPRAPLPGEAKDIQVPKGYTFKATTLASGPGPNGKDGMIEEIPLPNVFKEMNVPNSKGRGARGIG